MEKKKKKKKEAAEPFLADENNKAKTFSTSPHEKTVQPDSHSPDTYSTRQIVTPLIHTALDRQSLP